MKNEGNSTKRETNALSAFTLIELLVVIAIIGVLAALIVPLSGVATSKMRIARTKAELHGYVTAIESYKLETGSYPPDNGLLKTVTTSPFQYRSNAALNPLVYELTGAIFTNGQFRMVNADEVVTPAALDSTFHVSGIQNSARNKSDIAYKGFSLKASQYAELAPPAAPANTDIEVLLVPVPGPLEFQGKKKKINAWFYDSSTTNRHNRNGFDLWAEIIIGGKNETNVIANWKN